MGFFGSPSPEKQEHKLEGLKMTNEVVTKEAEIAEKRAVINDLKKRYGNGWMSIMGVKVIPDIATLRGFLSTAQKGGNKMGSSFINPNLSKPGSFGYKGKLLNKDV